MESGDMRLEVGQLVRLKNPVLQFRIGDYAILTEVDWDYRDYPNGMHGRWGRGYFFFPDRTYDSADEKHLGYLLLYDNFEVLDEG